MNEIESKVTKLINDIAEINGGLSYGDVTEELILQAFREVAEAQKEACHKKYKTDQAHNIAEKIKEANIVDYTGTFIDLSKSVLNTPLITDKTE